VASVLLRSSTTPVGLSASGMVKALVQCDRVAERNDQNVKLVAPQTRAKLAAYYEQIKETRQSALSGYIESTLHTVHSDFLIKANGFSFTTTRHSKAIRGRVRAARRGLDRERLSHSAFPSISLQICLPLNGGAISRPHLTSNTGPGHWVSVRMVAQINQVRAALTERGLAPPFGA